MYGPALGHHPKGEQPGECPGRIAWNYGSDGGCSLRLIARRIHLDSNLERKPRRWQSPAAIVAVTPETASPSGSASTPSQCRRAGGCRPPAWRRLGPVEAVLEDIPAIRVRASGGSRRPGACGQGLRPSALPVTISAGDRPLDHPPQSGAAYALAVVAFAPTPSGAASRPSVTGSLG